jgi:hypothetical protein
MSPIALKDGPQNKKTPATKVTGVIGLPAGGGYGRTPPRRGRVIVWAADGAVNTRRVTRPALDNGGRSLYGGSMREKA